MRELVIIKARDSARMRLFLEKFFTLTIFAGFLLVLFFQVPSADAHSALLEMEPAEDVVAEEPPSTLELRFNEPIDPDLAMVTIYDWNAKPVFTGYPDGNSERAPLLTFSLPDLKQGTYTVKWNIVSADGHPVDGSYAFSVGKATEGGVKSAGEDSDSESLLTIARVIPEGLILLGAGLFWFGWLAERRKFPSLDTLWKRGRWIGAVLIVLGTIAELIAYSFSLPPGIIQVILNGRWELLLQFPFVLMLFAQIFFLILVFIPGMERIWYLALWLLLAITPAFGGHVWGMENPVLALIPRIFHQMAIAFWLGALCYVILLIIWQKKQNNSISWKTFRPFFVNKMILASSLVIISGFIMVYLQSGVTGVFTDWKTWSTLVTIKVILTFSMIAMALYQTLKWKRKETFTTRRIIRTEWAVGLIVIIFGVWMSQIPYPIAVKSYDETLTENDLHADIHIDKLQMGDQTMIVDIPEQNEEQPEKVRVEVSMPQHDMGSGELTAEQDESGNYTIDLPFTMPGTWLLEITATYPNDDKTKWQDDMFIEGNND